MWSQDLKERADAKERDVFAFAAIKVGVLAIRQASGVIDTRAIHEEGERLILTMRQALKDHTELVSGGVSTILSKYFDPTGGELPQRIDRLIRRDGELEGSAEPACQRRRLNAFSYTRKAHRSN